MIPTGRHDVEGQMPKVMFGEMRQRRNGVLGSLTHELGDAGLRSTAGIGGRTELVSHMNDLVGPLLRMVLRYVDGEGHAVRAR